MKAVRIPKDRVAVLIGTDGITKAYIEERLGVKLQIDSEGEVMVLEEEQYDPLAGLKAIDVVKAIGRGFSPQHAYRLFDDSEYLEIIDMKDYVGGKVDHLNRQRARLIGTAASSMIWPA